MATRDVVDAHLHLWQPSAHPWYPALEEAARSTGLASLCDDFLVEDHLAAAGPLRPTGMVHVSAVTAPRRYLDETRWVTELADAQGLDLVLLGTVDPRLPLPEITEDLAAQAESPRFRGVRVLDGLTPGSPAADHLLSWLRKHGFVFDLVAHPSGLADWIDCLADHPDLAVVLEHTGWPEGVGAESRSAWREAMAAVASRTDWLVKVSGLGMATQDLSAAALRPWIEQAVELLGWDRVAYGSNMPFETIAGGYAELVASVTDVLGEASADEQRRFFAANARRAYRF